MPGGQAENEPEPFQPFLLFDRARTRPIVKQRFQVAGSVHLVNGLEQVAVVAQDLHVRLGLFVLGDRDAAEDSLLTLDIDLDAAGLHDVAIGKRSVAAESPSHVIGPFDNSAALDDLARQVKISREDWIPFANNPNGAL